MEVVMLRMTNTIVTTELIKMIVIITKILVTTTMVLATHNNNNNGLRKKHKTNPMTIGPSSPPPAPTPFPTHQLFALMSMAVPYAKFPKNAHKNMIMDSPSADCLLVFM